MCVWEAVQVPATTAQSPTPVSLHRGSSQDPTPAGAPPCSQPGTPAPSPDRPARDSVSNLVGTGTWAVGGLGPGSCLGCGVGSHTAQVGKL